MRQRSSSRWPPRLMTAVRVLSKTHSTARSSAPSCSIAADSAFRTEHDSSRSVAPGRTVTAVTARALREEAMLQPRSVHVPLCTTTASSRKCEMASPSTSPPSPPCSRPCRCRVPSHRAAPASATRCTARAHTSRESWGRSLVPALSRNRSPAGARESAPATPRQTRPSSESTTGKRSHAFSKSCSASRSPRRSLARHERQTADARRRERLQASCERMRRSTSSGTADSLSSSGR
mmetsp:Transcript_44950/g.146032  ORF Transcript_44950/g.146032 Transcript_44950/m.146032 type:complete len:235 (-) Transcript_44950:1039-1743(-)